MNLLLLSIDSLRVDFVSRTNPRIRTPRFDAATRAFSFSDRCFSVSSATRPVHSSLFTGLYPFEHGVRSQRTPAMRRGCLHLFDLFAAAGYQAAGFSQARAVFAGLEFSPWIRPLHPAALRPAVLGPGRRFVFVHYWDTHTPYGAADARALGLTAQLLSQGRRQEVIAGYQAAVERVFEEHVAPLLERLALEQWMVVILGDHGESWTDEEPYHGQTLNNSVLRVPLYLHLPFSGNPPFPGAIHSLVDVFATVDHLFGLHSGYQGYGRDLRALSRPTPYLAELDPGPFIPAAGAEPGVGLGRPNPGPQWALLEATRKFTFWERSGACRLEDPFSGQGLEMDPGGAERYTSAYRTLVANSAYAALPAAGAEPDPLVDQRLRDLGYL